MEQTNLIRATRPVQPTVEQPPGEGDLWRSLRLYLRLRDRGLLDGAAWDIARARCWPHWRREAAA